MTKNECIQLMGKTLVEEQTLNAELWGLVSELSGTLGQENIPEKVKQKIPELVPRVNTCNINFETIMAIKKFDDDEPMPLFAN